ncbi:Smr/MutS family protein [Thalassospira sp.]|uniref:Smr/MutS family protein n=1 Tax=Thalassospira sp. TaxID=1912094 RepID=UPI002734EBBF|nr:Smr/MutS family protein [Thalassospira sp.]MDP2699248.1 Smr/MutS family protein [Thalassospira sp.]
MTRNHKPKKHRSVSDSEKALWEAFTHDVKPLRSRKKERKGATISGLLGDVANGPDNGGEDGDTALSQPGFPTQPLREAMAKSEENRATRNLPSARDADRGPQIKNPQTTELKPGVTAGIDGSTARKFQKGQMTIDGRIDLHGMTQEVAHHALDAFINDCWYAGKRCVLVITGKGSRADEYGRTGLLRSRTPQWLSAPHLRPRILAISQASIQHGGAGAYYVLLKRRRP